MTLGALVVSADMTARKAKAKGAASAAPESMHPQAWIDEIGAMHRAQVYGDVEPLLQCLERQGLEQPLARAFVADLARKAKAPAARDEVQDSEDYRIAMLVANRQGLLVREGKSPKRAAASVQAEMELQGVGGVHRTVKRATERAIKHYSPAVFEPFYRLGLQGFRITI